MLNGLASLQSLLHLNHKVHSVNNHLHQLHLSHQVHCHDHISKLQKYIVHCCHTPLICPDGPCWRCHTPLPQLPCPHHQSHAFAAAVSPVYLQNEGARAEGGVRMGSKQVAYEWCIPYRLSIWLHMRQLQDLHVGTHLTQMWYLDVHSGPQSCPKVGGAGEDVPQVFVPHKLMVVLLNQSFHLHTWPSISQINGVDIQPTPTSLSPLQNRVKTSCMLPPFCMEMTLVWSSSFTQTRNVLR